MQPMLDVKNLERHIEEVARTYRDLTGMEIQPGRTAEIPPEKDPVTFVNERYQQLVSMLGARAPTPTAVLPWVPPVDVYESETEIVVTVDLPGVHGADVSVQVQDGVLALRAERRPEPPSEGMGVRASERPYGIYQRIVPLTSRVVSDKIEAKTHGGVLTVRLEREAAARLRSEREAAGRSKKS